MTQEIFIERAKKIYGNRFDYYKVVYKGWDDEVIVIDNFLKEERAVKPKYFLYHKIIKTKEERTNIIINKSKEKFGNKFDYSKVKYVNSQTPITLICEEHGEFNTDMYRHLHSKNGNCPLCNLDGRGYGKKLSTSSIIERCQYIYGDKYDYSKIEYKGGNAKTEIVELVCSEHGSFFKKYDSIQKRDCGCPVCAKKRARKQVKITTEEFKEKFI